eukprot:Rhum_TRINITY_DN14050_c0_g1::Rhum_TRINITY_DN14050_c0_g1_i2::g.67992::m.67992
MDTRTAAAATAAVGLATSVGLWHLCSTRGVVVEEEEEGAIPTLTAEQAARLRLRPRFEALSCIDKELCELQAAGADADIGLEVEFLLERILKELERTDAVDISSLAGSAADADVVRGVRKSLVQGLTQAERALLALKASLAEQTPAEE